MTVFCAAGVWLGFSFCILVGMFVAQRSIIGTTVLGATLLAFALFAGWLA
jgi:hypothetical protein